MTSAYSFAQIVGGLVLGALSDRALSRRTVLIISFLGSALSYGTIGLSNSLNMLLAGRVIVGLVKQVRRRAHARTLARTHTRKLYATTAVLSIRQQQVSQSARSNGYEVIKA